MEEEIAQFGENINWKKIEDPKSYYPTRLEYFAGKIVMALVQGRSLKDHRTCIKHAVELASELEDAIDEYTAKG